MKYIIQITNKESLDLIYVSGFNNIAMTNGNHQFRFAYSNNKKHAIKKEKEEIEKVANALLEVINLEIFNVKIKKTLN